jgi:hypothetical protein
MDLDDLFDRNDGRGARGHRDHDREYGHAADRYRERDDHPYNRDSYGDSDRWGSHGGSRRRGHDDDKLFEFSQIAHRLLANKKLLIPAGVLLLAVAALAAVFLLPLLGPLVDYVAKNGLLGVVEGLLKGAGEGK